MNLTTKSIALAVGGALALSITASVSAGENPFAIKSLASGYQVADGDTKMKDGKCGEGKCSANKKKAMEEKHAAEGNCSADKKASEGNCSADKK